MSLPQSIVNVKPDPSEETEEEKEQKHKSFVDKYEKEIKHFGENRLWIILLVLHCLLHLRGILEYVSKE